jgi:hypothetical protein
LPPTHVLNTAKRDIRGITDISFIRLEPILPLFRFPGSDNLFSPLLFFLVQLGS